MKELEDYSWFPLILRKFQMDFIGFVVTKFHFYDVFIEYLQKQNLENTKMYDLCSGSGEPAIYIFSKSTCFSKLFLSDKFPSSDKIIFADVLEMDFQKGFCYTMFNAFHHFTDDEKLKLISKINNSGARAYFVEILEPNLIFIIKVMSLTLIGNLFITPFIKPFSITRIILTYIIPINLFTITYDGVISILKSKSVKQYKEILPDYVHIFQLKKKLSSLVVIEIK